MKNEQGFLVFDFIFAFLIVVGMSMLLLTTNFSLSMIETIQYMTFASSRSYYAADISEEEQKISAEEKFENLKEQRIIKNLLNKNLFTIISEPGDHSNHFGDNNNKNLLGTKTTVKIKVLSKSLPVIGSAGSEDDFQTTVLSLLGREPSMMECMSALNTKNKLIQNLYGGLDNFNTYNIWDNGC